MLVDKYKLYELSVQSPETHIEWFSSMYRDLFDKEGHHLREDFCGTFKLSCEWVKFNKNNTALSIDLDPEPLQYGKSHHWKSLSPLQKKRLQILNSDVMFPTPSKKDIIIACNFSFYIFKQRELLLKYFRSCLKSLNSHGALILEMAGGPGMIAPMKEQKTIFSNRKKKFTYIWHQKSFDPITHDAQYAIHFKFPTGKVMKDVFTYDWRLWTIPEVRELMLEAGFEKTYVYWEATHRGQGTGEYIRLEKGDNSYAWIAYLVGAKSTPS